MRRLLSLLLLFFALPAAAGLFDSRPSVTLGGLNNSADFLPVREAFRLNLIDASPELVKLRFVAAEGYYLYRHQFKFRTDTPGVVIAEANLPAGEQKTDDYFGEVEVYYGVLDVELPIRNPQNQPFTLQVTYQGCADKGLCYPPETESLDIGGAPTGPPKASTPDSPTNANAGLSWRSVALFFLAGLGLTFTPCVLPMLPILSGVVLRGQIGGMRSFGLSLAYVLPMAAGFAVLGAL
ncbi:MAG TPA: protein-disulfide reductase DsbD, partial [Pseudomonas sp.]|nr:protein-disulfide reductase DsbD [Pseudomonas sp.]